jgi:Protein of unknown function (DUF3105)
VRRRRLFGGVVAPIAAALVLLTGCSSGGGGAGTATISEPPTTSTLSSSSSGSTASGSATTASSAGSDDDRWTPTSDHPDPSVDIDGIYVGDPALYDHRYHFASPDRVAYNRFPPVGGPHDPVWTECDGTVYDVPIRNENMVHSLEHGAVWIAYNPDTLAGDDLAALTELVPQIPFLVMTPYPDLDTPLSLQSWAHQLALDSADDPRFTQFVQALLRNPYTTPEYGATCSSPSFDPAAFPFDPTPPGPDAIPMDFTPPAQTS